jgi:hypothetical protein
MKQRLTINEVDNLISMLNSSDKDTILLALSIILSRSYKSIRLNTAIYNARLAQREILNEFKRWDEDFLKTHLDRCIRALERYKKKIRAV